MKIAQRLAFATVILTIVLIAIGAYVRATGSGLGCPDWPTCHGGVVPPNGKHPIIEFSHRFTASVVGLMVIGTAVLAWRFYRHVPFVLWTATAAVPMVGFQGILGAITVKRELPPEIVATHLVFAMLVLSCEIAAAVAMYREDPSHQAAVSAGGRRIGGVALITMAWMAAVLWIGGYMAESGASAACSGWPTCNGSLLPGNHTQEITHMVHRYLAGALLFFVVALVLTAWRLRGGLPWAGVVAVAAAGLYGAQVLVGALNVWYSFPDLLTVSHTAIAGTIWAVLSFAVLLALYAPTGERAAPPLRAAEASA